MCQPAAQVLIDLPELSGRCLNQPKLVSTVLRAFSDSLRKNAQALADAQRSGNFAAVAQTAHTIKGSALNVAAKPLANVVTELERAARSGDAQRTTDLANAFAQLVQPTLDAAAAILQAGTAPAQAAA